MDNFSDVLRIFNLVSTLVLLVVTVAAVAWRWMSLDPVQRLFAMGFCGLICYVLSTTYYGLSTNVGFRWYLVLPAISNIWLITVVIVLALRPIDTLERR